MPLDDLSRRLDDLDMMHHPERWPLSVLPLKMPGRVFGEGGLAIYIHPNQFAVGMLGQDSRDLTWEEKTPEEIVADGWVVD